MALKIKLHETCNMMSVITCNRSVTYMYMHNILHTVGYHSRHKHSYHIPLQYTCIPIVHAMYQA